MLACGAYPEILIRRLRLALRHTPRMDCKIDAQKPTISRLLSSDLPELAVHMIRASPLLVRYALRTGYLQSVSIGACQLWDIINRILRGVNF